MHWYLISGMSKFHLLHEHQARFQKGSSAHAILDMQPGIIAVVAVHRWSEENIFFKNLEQNVCDGVLL